MLIDDHELVRTALGRLLAAQPDIEVVGQASTTEQAVDLIRQSRPDIVILDLLLPGHQSGKEFAVQLLESDPRLAVLVVSSRLEPLEIQFLVEAGIRGY